MPRQRASRWSSSPGTTTSARSSRARSGSCSSRASPEPRIGPRRDPCGGCQGGNPDRARARGNVPAMAAPDQIRLLLVEDVPQVAQYVRGLLQAQSTVRLIDIVSDGSLVPARISEHRPDVVVVDALLQGRVRGMQLVKQLHESEVGGPVVVMTVPQNPVSPHPDKGIAQVLSMPFNGYDLMSTITGVHKAAAASTDHGPSKL